MLSKALYYTLRGIYRAGIPSSSYIGGCCFWRSDFGIIVSPESISGKNIVIQYGVTIGEIADKAKVFVNNCLIGAKAIILGGMHMENDIKTV